MLKLQRGAVYAAVAAIAAGALAGCNKPGSTSTSADTFGNVAIVNGTPITTTEFYADLKGFRPSPNQPTVPAGAALLQQLIGNLLIEQVARNAGVYPSDADIDEQFKEFQIMQGQQSVKPFDEQLVEAGLTPDVVKSLTIIPRMCQMNLVTRGITVTDADINAFYELHKGDVYTMPERVHLKRIVLATQADAQDISNQISKGAAFESFLSRSTNKQYQDGDMPAWVSVENSPKQIQQFVDQVKNLSIGQTTPPIEYQGTWWLVKVVDKKPHEVIPLDSVKESVRIQVLSQKVGADQSHVQQMTQDLRNAQMAAKIVITLPQYQPLIALINNPPVQQMAPPAQPGGGGQPPAGGGGAPPPGGGGQPSGGGPPTQ